MAKPENMLRRIIQENRFPRSRSFDDYVKLLGGGFHQVVDQLKPEQSWIDMGSGDAKAQIDVLESRRKSTPKLTAVSYRAAVSSHEPRLKIIRDRMFSEISLDEFKEAELITDVVGILNYTDDLSQTLNAYLRLLSNQGCIYVFQPSVLTWIISGAGKPVPLYLWLCSQKELKVAENLRTDFAQYNQSSFCIKKKIPRAQVGSLRLSQVRKVEDRMIRTFIENERG